MPTPDTVVSTQKRAWGRVAGDTLLWIGSRDEQEGAGGRDTLAIRGQKLIQISRNFNLGNYRRATSPIVLENHFHPRPAPAPTGLLAQLVGTWERQDGCEPGRCRTTIRADSTIVITYIGVQGADTTAISTGLEYLTVAGDTVWWEWAPQRPVRHVDGPGQKA